MMRPAHGSGLLEKRSADCKCAEDMRLRSVADDELPSTRMFSSGGTVLARFSFGASSTVGVVALRFVAGSVVPFMLVAPLT